MTTSNLAAPSATTANLIRTRKKVPRVFGRDESRKRWGSCEGANRRVSRPGRAVSGWRSRRALIVANTRAVKLDWVIGSTHASWSGLSSPRPFSGWLLGVSNQCRLPSPQTRSTSIENSRRHGAFDPRSPTPTYRIRTMPDEMQVDITAEKGRATGGERQGLLPSQACKEGKTKAVPARERPKRHHPMDESISNSARAATSVDQQSDYASKKNAAEQPLDAGGGSRTLMPPSGTPDFKSGASDRFRHPGAGAG